MKDSRMQRFVRLMAIVTIVGAGSQLASAELVFAGGGGGGAGCQSSASQYMGCLTSTGFGTYQKCGGTGSCETCVESHADSSCKLQDVGCPNGECTKRGYENSDGDPQ
jgi:hypothetical protein